MTYSRLKAKGRREVGAFLSVPFSVLNSHNYKLLSGKRVKLLFDVASQLRMKRGGPCNNGDLCITPKIMKDRGWNSRESLFAARDELLHYGFILITRLGGRNRPHLYALTFFAIDECGGKLDASETKVPLNDWKKNRKKWLRRTKQKQKNNQVKIESLYRYPESVVPITGSNTFN